MNKNNLTTLASVFMQLANEITSFLSARNEIAIYLRARNSSRESTIISFSIENSAHFIRHKTLYAHCAHGVLEVYASHRLMIRAFNMDNN